MSKEAILIISGLGFIIISFIFSEWIERKKPSSGEIMGIALMMCWVSFLLATCAKE
jgi:hypothetical protein